MAIKRKWCVWIAGTALVLVALGALYVKTRPVDEVLLTIGEPYEQVRQQSRSTLPPVEPGSNWGGVVTRPAKLRFTDPQFGLSIPPAKFLSVAYDADGRVSFVTLSPQVETLPLGEALAIVFDLQNQLRRGGWRQVRVKDNPALTDTPAVREKIRSGMGGPITYWIADDKYQVIIDIGRFVHENRPEDERYLITLELSGPPYVTE